MRKIRGYHWTNHHIIIFVSFLILALVGATALVWNSFRSMVKHVDVVCENMEGKQKRIAFVPDDPTDEFMLSVYKSVQEEAEKQGIYVEYMGEGLSESYTKQELLELAIAARVDGIILEGDRQKETSKRIAEAKEKKIPVITIRSDSIGSERTSFVGVNNYTLGHSYANQILNLSYHKTSKNVVILMDKDAIDSGQTIIYSSLCQTLEECPGVKFNIYPVQIAREVTFEAEEQIRNIFVEDELPDVIVCLNQLYTTCAIQAIIDQNKVGQTELIGFYDNRMIRESILENVLYCSISIDINQMGQTCVESLQDIWNTGYVSEYYSVDTFLINKDTCKEKENEKES